MYMMTTGLKILAFGLTGVTVVVLLAALALFARRNRTALTIQDGTLKNEPLKNFYGPEPSISLSYLAPSNYSESEDSTSLKITLKDVYVATNNLSAANFIGQGIAGKNMP